VLYLVRHADAGDKRAWNGPDDHRPLTSAGHRQARRLPAQLDGDAITAIVSSPTVRCLQTVEPLAWHRGLEVRTDARLDVDANPDAALALLLDASSDQAVWCTHGELIGELLTRLRARGAPIGDGAEWRKGSIWRLHVVAGQVAGAIYLPPPDG
jgi:phosphohistidine phosphatase SixA